jgi:hypothetical protein
MTLETSIAQGYHCRVCGADFKTLATAKDHVKGHTVKELLAAYENNPQTCGFRPMERILVDNLIWEF